MNISDEAVISELVTLQALASKTRGGTPLQYIEENEDQ